MKQKWLYMLYFTNAPVERPLLEDCRIFVVDSITNAIACAVKFLEQFEFWKLEAYSTDSIGVIDHDRSLQVIKAINNWRDKNLIDYNTL